MAAALAAHADGADDDDRRAAERGAAIGHTARQSAPFDDDEDVDAPARRRPATSDSWQAVRERYVDAPSGDSWQAVRERYVDARAAAAAVVAGGALGRAAAGRLVVGRGARRRPTRGRRRAAGGTYGDEIVN